MCQTVTHFLNLWLFHDFPSWSGHDKTTVCLCCVIQCQWCSHSHQQGVAHSQTTKTQLHSVLCWNQTNQDNMVTYIHPLHSCKLICTAHTVFPFLLLSLLARILFICLSSSPQTSWLEGRDVGWNWPIWEQVLPEQWVLFWLVLCKLCTVCHGQLYDLF